MCVGCVRVCVCVYVCRVCVLNLRSTRALSSLQLPTNRICIRQPHNLEKASHTNPSSLPLSASEKFLQSKCLELIFVQVVIDTYNTGTWEVETGRSYMGNVASLGYYGILSQKCQ